MHHNIAILHLKNDIDLETYTPACLPKDSEKERFDGKNATVAGWGWTYQSSDLEYEMEADVPHHIVDMEIINWKSCPGMKGSNKDPEDKSPSEICVKHPSDYPELAGTCFVRF